MRILLTGGAGYVGSACLRWLLGRGLDPVAFDDLSTGNAEAVPPDRLIVGDILDRDGLSAAAAGCDAVLHFAALASVPESLAEPDRYWRTNLVGTLNVLDAMRDHGIRKLVFSSTAATYDFDAPMPLTEESPQHPRVPYGESKLAAERAILDHARAYGLGAAILRYFNAAGADPDGRHGECRVRETHLVPKLLAAALEGEEAILFGDDWSTPDGTCVRDYIHVVDLAQAHHLALEALAPGERRIYNLGTGRGASVLEVLRACEQVIGYPIPYRVEARRAGDPPVLIADPSRISRELGWTPAHPELVDIVRSAWSWHRNRPEGYRARTAAAPPEAPPGSP